MTWRPAPRSSPGGTTTPIPTTGPRTASTSTASLAGMSNDPPDTGAVGNARLGAGFDNAENFSGQIDDVRIYNRALPPDELLALRDGRE